MRHFSYFAALGVLFIGWLSNAELLSVGVAMVIMLGSIADEIHDKR